MDTGAIFVEGVVAVTGALFQVSGNRSRGSEQSSSRLVLRNLYSERLKKFGLTPSGVSHTGTLLLVFCLLMPKEWSLNPTQC